MAENAYRTRMHSTLRSPTRTSYYNSFFLYKTEVVLNGQPAEIGCSEKGELSLSCRSDEEGIAQPSISFPSISARVEEILRKYGVFEVVSFFCEDSPLFQVTFSSAHSLKKFVQSRGRVGKELAALFSEMLQPKQQQAGATGNHIPATVNSKLFLMTPDWFGRQCGSIEVTSDNFSDCMFVWKNSEVFEFGVVLSQQKGVYTGSIRKSKGTSTSDLRPSQDKGTNTCTSGLRLSNNEEGNSMNDLAQSENEAASANDVRLSQDEDTSMNDLRQSLDESTSTSDLRLYQNKTTSMSNLSAQLSDSDNDPKAEANGSTDPKELQQEDVGLVLRWLEEVFEWFFLGTYLDIPHHELKIIEQNHPSNSKQCKVEMVHTWIRLGGASWSALVGALWESGRRALAKKLADEFEITLPATDALPDQKSSVQCELLTDISQKDQQLDDTTATLVLAEEQRSQALEDIAQATRQLKESISKLPQLEQDKKQLTSQLLETRDALKTLEGKWWKQKPDTYATKLLKQETVRLQDQLHQRGNEIAMIAAEAKDMKTNLQETAEALELTSSELSKLKAEQHLLNFELERKRREVEKEQYRLLFKDETIKELKEELIEMKAEENFKMKEIGALGERLSSQSEEVERLRKALQEAEQQKPDLQEQPSAASVTVQQQLLHTMETSELRVKLVTAEAGRQEAERQLGALQRQVLLLKDYQLSAVEPIPFTVDLVGSNTVLIKQFFKLLSVDCSCIRSPTYPMDSMDKSFTLSVAKSNCYQTMQFDDCVIRAEIPGDCFDSEGIIPPQFSPAREDLRPRFKRVDKSIFDESPGKNHFIVQQLNPDIRREQFVHLFLRSSGVCLLLVDLQDILDDPMIQYGNITQWLHLLHAYLTPNYAKRVIVVGTYHRSQVQDAEILKLVKHLSAAIANRTNQVYRIPFEGEGYVFRFDLDNQQQNAYCLCACVQKCMKIIIESTYYRQGNFFTNAFEPFLKLGSLCAKLSSMAAHGKIVATAQEIRQAFASVGYHLTIAGNYLDSLSIYSSGLISTNPASGSMLNPGFIMRVLEKMELAGHMYINGFKLTEQCVQQLPVVSEDFVKRQMDMQKFTDQEDKNTVMQWMKKMNLIFEVGTSIYFIPFYAMPVAPTPTWRWSDEEEGKFHGNDTTVLFTKLRFPATPHFLYSLIAVLIQDILKLQNSYQSCFINLGCNEAILPLCSSKHVLTSALLKYHETANFIEFRAHKSIPKRELLDATQEKLEAAYAKSQFSSVPFKDAIAFHTPALNHDRSLVEGPIWQLGCVTEGEGDEDDPNSPSSVLPKTKYLAAPGDYNTKELQEWGSTSSQDKELPPSLMKALELYLGSYESYWTGVAMELHLLTRDEINFFRYNMTSKGNGCQVMDRWKESNCSLQDLVDALKVVGLEEMAKRVRKLYVSH